MITEIRPLPLGPAGIINKAEKLINDYIGIVGLHSLRHRGIRFDDVYDQIIYPKHEIILNETTNLGNDEEGKKILGFFEPAENRAYVCSSLKNDPRRAFTQWHEVAGHGVLQGEWLRNQFGYGRIVTTEASLSPVTDRILERQANLFASQVAAPTWYVEVLIRHFFRPTKPFFFFRPCHYCLEVNGTSTRRYVASYEDLCHVIGGVIQPFFGRLSKEALGYQVKETGWVVDKSTRSFQLFRKSEQSLGFNSLKKHGHKVLQTT